MGGPSKLGIQDPKLSSSTSWPGVHNEHAPLGSPAADAPGLVGKAKGDKPAVLFSRDAPGKLLDRIATFFKDVKAKLGQLLERAQQRFPKLSAHEFKNATKEHTFGAKVTKEVLEARIAELSKPAEDPTATAPAAKADAPAPQVKVFRSRNDSRYFVVQKPLGSGGLAEVYQANKLNQEQAYAVKKAHGQLSNALSKEIAIHKSLMQGEHSHIVEFVDDFVDRDNKQALVMEALEGSVKQEIKNNAAKYDHSNLAGLWAKNSALKSMALPTDLQQSAFEQMALGVQQMHAQGIAHGDIKPENFFVRKTTVDGVPGIVVKVADFGSAWDASDPDSDSKWNGETSAQYMAPEMAFGEPKNVGKAADVFALGLSALAVFGIRDNGLYEGEGDPAKRAKADQFLANLIQDTADVDLARQPRPHIQRLAEIGVRADTVQPPELFDLLTKMLDPDPRVRPTIDEVLRHPYFSDSAPPSTNLPVSSGKQEV